MKTVGRYETLEAAQEAAQGQEALEWDEQTEISGWEGWMALGRKTAYMVEPIDRGRKTW